ncbi:MAG TPA: molybdenum cofactor guanylyltransferase [Verrucomicrobiae bacterium]|nr:molybdenum cofactor guanylyltransferase [Verrucomicrobiae bacterium]
MTFTALLLTGGLSTRMGTDKALVRVKGEPLWRRQIRILRELQPDHLVVSARTKPRWLPLDVAFAADTPPSKGPLSGLVAALERLQTSHLLALAIDLPNMTTAYLRELLSIAGERHGVAPTRGDYVEPLCAIYHRDAFPCAQDSLAAGRFSLQELATILHGKGLMEFVTIIPDEEHLFLNANTPTDLDTQTSA